MMRDLLGLAATVATAAATSSREIGATRPCPVGGTSSPDAWLGTTQRLRIKSEYRPHLRMVEGRPLVGALRLGKQARSRMATIRRDRRCSGNEGAGCRALLLPLWPG